MDRTAGVLRLWDIVFREPIGSVEALDRSDSGAIVPRLSQIHPSARTVEACESIKRGLQSGLDDRLGGIRALDDVTIDLDELKVLGSLLSRSIVARPPAKLAQAILSLDFEEGAKGSKGSIGWAGLRNGVAWYPGLLSQSQLGPLHGSLERLVNLAGWWQRRGG